MGAHANIGTGQISTTMQGSMAALKGLEVRVFHGETDELIRGDWCVTLTPPSPVSRPLHHEEAQEEEEPAPWGEAGSCRASG